MKGLCSILTLVVLSSLLKFPSCKLKNEFFREFLEKYTQHTILDESTLRRMMLRPYTTRLYKDKRRNYMRSNLAFQRLDYRQRRYLIAVYLLKWNALQSEITELMKLWVSSGDMELSTIMLLFKPYCPLLVLSWTNIFTCLS